MPDRRILIIDDDEAIRSVVCATLSLIDGWIVLEAGGGEEGLTIAAAEQPDAIILDLDMPGMDGPTTYDRLLENHATVGIPVVVLTANAQAGVLKAMEQKGLRGVFSKPFDPIALPTQLATALRWTGFDTAYPSS